MDTSRRAPPTIIIDDNGHGQMIHHRNEPVQLPTRTDLSERGRRPVRHVCRTGALSGARLTTQKCRLRTITTICETLSPGLLKMLCRAPTQRNAYTRPPPPCSYRKMALNSSLKLPYVWARFCTPNPQSTRWPAPRQTSTTAGLP